MNHDNPRPRILFVTPFWPHRTGLGAEVRSRLTLDALRAHADVDVVVLEDADEPAAVTHGGDATGEAVRVLTVRPRPRQGLGGRLRWLFDPDMSHPHGCGVDEAEAEALRARLASYDLVWFFKLRAPNMFSAAAWPRSVLDIDDVPSTYERVALGNGGGLAGRFQALLRWWSWRRREQRLGERFSVLAVCSDGDREYLRGLGVKAPIHVLPNGVAAPAVEPVHAPTQPPRIGFIGLFDYRPNHEGVAWFGRECWPRIKAALPDARLRLVGRGSNGPLKPAGPDIDGLGWLADPAAEISSWSVSIVPIRLGAGTRVKIAHGFGQKCPMVSTTLGAYGYEVANGRELILADTPEAFARACVHLVQNPLEARQMADRAWRQFLTKWSWDAIRPRVWAAAAECLRTNAGRASATQV